MENTEQRRNVADEWTTIVDTNELLLQGKWKKTAQPTLLLQLKPYLQENVLKKFVNNNTYMKH